MNQRGPARRTAAIAPFHVMDILAQAKQLASGGADVIHMEVGEPDFPTPAGIVAAGHAALEAGHTHYTASLGLDALRFAVAAHYAQVYGVEVSAQRIAVTVGASGALFLAMASALEPGARVLMADPGYPCNRHMLRLLGVEVDAIPVGADTAYQLTAELVARHWTPDTRAVLAATPSNPTGTLLDANTLDELAALCRDRGAHLLVDEIYQLLRYAGAPHTALAHGDDVWVINSFSKYFGMTGWRLGWLVMPEAHIASIDKLAQNLFLAAPTMAQYAALEAFSAETTAELERRRQAFQQRRDVLIPGLKQLGFEIPVEPQGAFYVYADSSAFGDDSFELCQRILAETHVAITPGIDFGTHRARQHLRFAYTTGRERLVEGLKRLEGFLGG